MKDNGPVIGLDDTEFTISYSVDGGAEISYTLSSGSLGDAHVEGLIIEKGDGWYWLGLIDAVMASVSNAIHEIACGTLGNVSIVPPIDVVLPATVPGSNPNTVTVTVDDGVDVLGGAHVRLYKDGVDDFNEITETIGVSEGDAVFHIPDGEYTASILLSGYRFTAVSLTVSGDGAVTYSMTQDLPDAIPSESPFILGQVLCLTAAGAVDLSGSVTIEQTKPSSTFGYASEKGPRTITADGSGIAWIPVLPGAVYKFQFPSSSLFVTTAVPLTAVDGYNLNSITG